MARGKDKPSITIVKKEEVVGGGHHGGAWKVAYADFVTAMMAFFLLMWLLNATTEAQRRGLADYFSPTIATARGISGSGKPFGGHSPFDDGPSLSDRGTLPTMNANAPPVDIEDDGGDTIATRTVHSDGTREAGNDLRPARRESVGTPQIPPQAAGAVPGPTPEQAAAQAEWRRVVGTVAGAVARATAGKPGASLVSVDQTPQGLRIQIRDADSAPMFPAGSAEPLPRTVGLLTALAPILARLNRPLSIAGFTDAAPYPGTGRTNWDLSADRANATRRVLAGAGLPDALITDVTGRADRDLLLPAQPLAASNRRVAIVVQQPAEH